MTEPFIFKQMKRCLAPFSVLALTLVGCEQGGESVDRDNKGEKQELDDRASAKGLSSEEVERLYSQATEFYRKGKYPQAKAVMTQAYAAFEQLPQKEEANRVNFLRELCKTSFQLREDEKATEYANQILTHAKADEDKAFAHSQLGSIRRRQGKHEQALDHHEKALELRLDALGEAHPEVAGVYHDVGVTWFEKGEYDRAISYHEQALSIWLNSLDPKDSRIASAYHGTGIAYGKKGAHGKAIVNYREALAIWKQSLDAKHPDLATAYNNLGVAQDGMGQHEEAIASHKNALSIRLSILDFSHPDIAASYSNLGSAYVGKNDFDQALIQHRKALVIGE